jgi:ribosomal protein L31E
MNKQDMSNNSKNIKKLEKNNSKNTMGKGEKIFWLFIAIFALGWLILQGLAYKNTHKNNQKQNISVSKNEPVLKTLTKTIIEIVDDNKTIRNNLENSETLKLLNENLSLKISNLNETIEYKVNQAFSPVYNKIDTFLDFHYSVVGEYTELIGAATDEIGSTIKDKLFGEIFDSDLEQVKEQVNHKYIETLKEHFNQIDTLATKDINKTLNSQIFSKLNEDIKQRTSVQIIKLGSIIGTATAVKIVGAVSAKIIAKTATKLAVKSSIKTAAKTAASGTAATVGLTCGPFVLICSSVAATVAWFGTDAIVVSADEYMNREEFKQDIIEMLDKEKGAIREKLQTSYANQFEKDSVAIQENLKNTIVKKKIEKTITIKERIFK